MGLFDKRTPEEKAADQMAHRLAERSCPLLIFYTGYNEITARRGSEYKFQELDKFKCMELDCRWWSQSDNECYILLACKKILGE